MPEIKPETVALLRDVKPTASEVYTGAGYEVELFDKSISQTNLAEIGTRSKVIGVRSGPEVSAEVFQEDNILEAINVFGVGTNHIHRRAPDGSRALGADDLGIAIINESHANTRSVAELVIGASFSLLRNLHEHNRQMHDNGKGYGIWTKTDGNEIRGKSMGIIGLGAIGGQLAVLAEALNMDVYYFDPFPQAGHGRAKRLSSIEEVLECSDIVSLNVPAGKNNRHLINEERLKLMKPTSFLINAARAELVDYEALDEALRNGTLAGAAVDVYTDDTFKEPSKKGDKFTHLLKDNPKVLLLPHIGGSTVEAQNNIGRVVAMRTLAFFGTGTTIGSANIPNINMEAIPEGMSRILNIHDNHPGVAAELSALVATHGINVAGIDLQTKEDLGYVGFTVEGPVPEDLMTEMRSLSSTRRAWTLAR